MPKKKIMLLDLGCTDYKKAYLLQKLLQNKRKKNLISNLLIIVQHPPTITVGKAGGHEYILASKSSLKKKNISIYEVERGGNVTFHGPGQLVAYPIINLAERGKDIHLYIYQLEEVIIRLLANYGIRAFRKKGYPGVWVNTNKIMAVGVAVNRWITMHGIAFNVNTDLSYYELIVPCGLKDKGITSLEKELTKKGKIPPDFCEVKEQYIQIFSKVFDYTVERVNDGGTLIRRLSNEKTSMANSNSTSC